MGIIIVKSNLTKKIVVGNAVACVWFSFITFLCYQFATSLNLNLTKLRIKLGIYQHKFEVMEITVFKKWLRWLNSLQGTFNLYTCFMSRVEHSCLEKSFHRFILNSQLFVTYYHLIFILRIFVKHQDIPMNCIEHIK